MFAGRYQQRFLKFHSHTKFFTDFSVFRLHLCCGLTTFFSHQCFWSSAFQRVFLSYHYHTWNILVSLGSENSGNGVYFENPVVFRNVLLVSGDWKSWHTTRWPSAYQRLKSTALEDVRLSRLAEVALTSESALRSNRFEYCCFWRRRGAAVLQNTWYRLLSSQLEQGTFKISKSVLAGPQGVARFMFFLNVT